MTVAIQQGVLAVDTSGDKPPTADNGQTPDGDKPFLAGERQPALGEPLAEIAPPIVSHHWRALSLGLLALLLVAAALFIYLQAQGSAAPPATSETPFDEQTIGETRWASTRPLPEARAGRAVAAVGLDVYFVGGETSAGVTNEVGVFQTQSRTWREATAKPTAVGETTADVLFGEIYVPGGVDADGQPSAVVEAYSPLQDAWRRIESLPQPVAGGLAVAEGGFLYFFGGRGPDGPLDTAYVYDPGSDSWRPIAALPEPRFGAAGGALTGRLYVVGGSNGEADQASCFAYDPPADAWEECPPMLRPRAGAGATVLLNKLYVLGGTGEPVEPAAWHGEVFDPNSRTWTVLNTPPDVTSWVEPGVTHVETRIYALGGRRDGALSDLSLVYSALPYQTFIPAAPSDSDE
jgi:N-acetylneuraminic acid mutarotase